MMFDLLAAVALCWSAHASGADLGVCRINVPSGDIVLAQPLELCPGIEIRGAPAMSTLLSSTSTVVHVLPYDMCRATGRPGSGVVILQDLALMTPSIDAPALVVQHETVIDRVDAFGGHYGVVFSCDGRRSTRSMCNASTVTRLRVFDAWSSGVKLDGGDVNAIAFRGGGVYRSCQSGDPDCAAIDSDGFLGSSWWGVLAAYSGSTCFRNSHPSARNTFFGGYCGDGTYRLELQPTDTAIGGIVDPWGGGGGGRIVGTRSSGLEFGWSDGMRLRLGPLLGPGSVWSVLAPDGVTNRWASFGFRPGPWGSYSCGYWRFTTDGTNAAEALRIRPACDAWSGGMFAPRWEP